MSRVSGRPCQSEWPHEQRMLQITQRAAERRVHQCIERNRLLTPSRHRVPGGPQHRDPLMTQRLSRMMLVRDSGGDCASYDAGTI